MKRKKKTIRIKIKPAKVAIGHQPHQSGSGIHDNRPKRERTRSAQMRKVMKEYA